MSLLVRVWLDLVLGLDLSLKRLDLLDQILAHGHRIETLRAVTETGRTVLDLAYADFRPELFGVGLHRGVLFRALHDAALAEPNIEITYGFESTCLEIAGADGAHENIVVGSSNERHGPFDLLIIADGRLSIRATTSAPAMEYHYPYGCLWTILPDPEGAFVTKPTLQQVLSAGSAHEMLGFLPCGRSPGMRKDEPSLVSLFWSLELSTLEALKAKGLEAWKARVATLEPRASPAGHRWLHSSSRPDRFPSASSSPPIR